jgi:hypothetical protein
MEMLLSREILNDNIRKEKEAKERGEELKLDERIEEWLKEDYERYSNNVDIMAIYDYVDQNYNYFSSVGKDGLIKDLPTEDQTAEFIQLLERLLPKDVANAFVFYLRHKMILDRGTPIDAMDFGSLFIGPYCEIIRDIFMAIIVISLKKHPQLTTIEQISIYESYKLIKSHKERNSINREIP